MKSSVYASRYDDIKYYSEYNGSDYIQLSDNHTIWKLDSLDMSVDDDTAEDMDYLYYSLVYSACQKFQEKSGVEVFLLGRSGRHVCVEDTDQNRRRYRSLCNLQSKLEKWVIDTYNKEVAKINNEQV